MKRIKQEKVHSWAIATLTVFLVWLVVNNFIFEIPLWQFIIIEICAGIGEIFSTLAKASMGIKTNTKLDKLNE
jgi:hypothetical protein